MKSRLLIAVFLLLVSFISFGPVSWAGGEEVIVRVDGLSCPFCAYGLEKKLKKMDGVDWVVINVEEGTATLSMKEGRTVDIEKVREAVREAGFTPRKVEVKEVD